MRYFNKSFSSLVILLLVDSCMFDNTAHAGVFTGLEADKDESSFSYIGGQTSGRYFGHFFYGQLEYEYTDAGTLITSDNSMLTLALGLRFGNNNSYSILLGGTEQTVNETSNNIETESELSGEFIQLGMNKNVDNGQIEFLSSYSSIENFVWSRLRYKHAISPSMTTGLEIFWMGNSKANSGGLGITMGNSIKWESHGAINLGLKLGIKQSTNDSKVPYAGLEIYLPFP